MNRPSCIISSVFSDPCFLDSYCFCLGSITSVSLFDRRVRWIHFIYLHTFSFLLFFSVLGVTFLRSVCVPVLRVSSRLCLCVSAAGNT